MKGRIDVSKDVLDKKWESASGRLGCLEQIHDKVDKTYRAGNGRIKDLRRIV